MTAVLFIHGFPFDHLLWRHQLAALSRWRCIAPDLPGAGTSPGFDSPDEYSMSSYATFLVGILDQLKVRQAVICGLSMGGYIVFELLRRFPERVRAAILCNTKAAADTPEAKRGRDALAAKAQHEGARAVAAELVPKVVARATRERRPEVVKEVTEMIARQPVPGIVGALRALRERPDSTPLLAAIRVPVLAVAGDDDQIAPAAGMQELARAIPGARFALVPDAGHVAPLEQPITVSSALADFLAKL
ncbi:MAG TPA: alpha/beta fold hydrolase [Gemmatimonadales bacterium]|nr:alpha/beta fold hydrolase [Gemmatimonadales bacterium]